MVIVIIYKQSLSQVNNPLTRCTLSRRITSRRSRSSSRRSEPCTEKSAALGGPGAPGPPAPAPVEGGCRSRAGPVCPCTRQPKTPEEPEVGIHNIRVTWPPRCSRQFYRQVADSPTAVGKICDREDGGTSHGNEFGSNYKKTQTWQKNRWTFNLNFLMWKLGSCCFPVFPVNYIYLHY